MATSILENIALTTEPPQFIFTLIIVIRLLLTLCLIKWYVLTMFYKHHIELCLMSANIVGHSKYSYLEL